jgi:hypothetical protein
MSVKLRSLLCAAATLCTCVPLPVAAAGLGVTSGVGIVHTGPGLRRSQRSGAAIAPSYTIHNVGYPSGFTLSTPGGFNDTGQIFGLVEVPRIPAGNGYVQDCRLWTGFVFVLLPLPATGTCSALAINDANAGSGQYEVVGAATEAFSVGTRAFAVIAGPAGFVKSRIYYANSPSSMVGVNASQLSVASAAFERDRIGDLDGQLYFTTAGAGSALATLQTPAAANAPPIHNLRPIAPTYYPAYPNPCAFGGCTINAANEVLGFDALTQTPYPETTTLAVYTVGNAASLRHLPLSGPILAPFPEEDTPVAFNNADRLVYLDSTTNEPAVLDIDTGTKTRLPVLPAGCPSYAEGVPLSMNDLGEVVGFNLNCTAPSAYWTWDPVHGTQYLASEIPPSAYTIYPLGVNDIGQILVQLVDANNVDYWGTLDPVHAPAARPKAPK